MSALVKVKIAAGVMTIQFNRPDKKNALTQEMYGALSDVLDRADSDPHVRAIVVTGAGDSFTAGNDLKEFVNSPDIGPHAPVSKFLESFSRLKTPVIAAVNGAAVGVGVTLLLHCDFAYAAPEAYFQLPFINLALVPEFASSLLLAHYVGARKATELLLLGEAFSAEAALRYGLLNQIVPANQLMAVAETKAAILAAKPPGAMRGSKALLRANFADIAACIDRERGIFESRLASVELKEAVAAFFEKRAPDYSRFV